jgi:hypothetical protein
LIRRFYIKQYKNRVKNDSRKSVSPKFDAHFHFKISFGLFCDKIPPYAQQISDLHKRSTTKFSQQVESKLKKYLYNVHKYITTYIVNIGKPK